MNKESTDFELSTKIDKEISKKCISILTNLKNKNKKIIADFMELFPWQSNYKTN